MQTIVIRMVTDDNDFDESSQCLEAWVTAIAGTPEC
jgi:hypothetical protein